MAGGRREGAGRPAFGVIRKVSISLPDEVWEAIEEVQSNLKKYLFTETVWNRFLDEHGTNPKLDESEEGRRLSGSDSVSQEAFEELVEYVNKNKNTYKEFKQLVFNQQDCSKLKYHLYKNGLFIVSTVEGVEALYGDAGIKISFKGGVLNIWAENEISKCFRPANLMIECETCFSLSNEYGKYIGYLYTEKESAE